MNVHLQFDRATLAFLISLCLAVPLAAQRRQGTRKLERTNTSIKEVQQTFEQGEADGLRVVIYQISANGIIAVDPRKQFKSGDRFKLNLKSNFDGYLYVINVEPGGDYRLLFPLAQSRRNTVRADQSYYIPAASEFQFTDEPGLELLQILMSRSPVPFLEKILDRAPAKAKYIPLDESAKTALQQLAGKSSRLKTSGILTYAASSPKSGIQTRLLTLDRKKDTTFLVVSGGKGTPARFRSGEVSMFEIRLNHSR